MADVSFRSLAGGGQACAYCGFCLVMEGPRDCCPAGRDYDALRAELASVTATMLAIREQRDGYSTELAALREAARKMLCAECLHKNWPSDCPRACADLRKLLGEKHE
jgi:hypothetical protein